MDMSGPVAIFLFFLLLLVDMFFYGFDAAIDNLNEKEILHKAEEEKDRRSMRLSEMISKCISTGNIFSTGVHCLNAFLKRGKLFCQHDPKTGDSANAKSHNQTAEHVFKICHCARFAYLFPPKQFIEREEYEDKDGVDQNLAPI